MSIDYAARARALVGTRFRPQGRSSDGLDCLGVVLAAFGIPAGAVLSNYRLRGDRTDEIGTQLRCFFRPVAPEKLRSGDALVLAVSGDQLHLGVRTDAGFVHAHAGIGRVVETP